MSVQRRKCKLCDGYTVVYVGKNGARGRNRTTDTRIFKTCVLNRLLKVKDKLAQKRGERKTV